MKLVAQLLLLVLLVADKALPQAALPLPEPSPAGPTAVQQESAAPSTSVESDGQPIAAESPEHLAESLHKTAEALSAREDELKKVKREKALLDAENGQLRAVIESLRTEASPPIDNIALVDRFITSNSAAFRLEANRYGSLKVILHDSSGAVVTVGGRAAVVTTGSSPTFHDAFFSPLLPGTSYWIEASAISPGGKDGFRRGPEQIRGFNFTTLETQVAPVIAIMGAEPTATAMTIKYRLGGADSFVQVECLEQVGGARKTISCGTEGAIVLGDLGRTVGKPGQTMATKGDHEVHFEGLQPDHNYEFRATAVTTEGVSADSPQADDWYHTLAAFDFDGPVTLQLGPLGITLTWNSTAAITSGSLQVHYAEQNLFVSQELRPESNNPRRLAATVPLNALTSILSRPLDEPPTLIAAMDDGATHVKRELRFSVAVPRDPTQIPGWQSLSKERKAQIQDLADQALDKGKVDWKALAKAGIPIILSLF